MAWIEQRRRADGGLTARVIWRLGGGRDAVRASETFSTVGVLAVLALTGSYITPYRTPLGQMILVLLLGGYVATLVWMRRMAAGKPLPRFIGATARQQAES
jgi:hypothetical protein